MLLLLLTIFDNWTGNSVFKAVVYFHVKVLIYDWQHPPLFAKDVEIACFIK